MALWCGGNERESFNIKKLANNATYGESWFRNFTWLAHTTQIYHSIMKYQIEAFRRGVSAAQNTPSALVWQLNAPWTTLALNSIDYTERWKVVQYVTQQVFERVVVCAVWDGEEGLGWR
jgi:beta-galactosidase/beta-glucuronidase